MEVSEARGFQELPQDVARMLQGRAARELARVIQIRIKVSTSFETAGGHDEGSRPERRLMPC
jgi:hypothetical protein